MLSQFVSNYIQVCALRRGILELMLGSLNNLSFRSKSRILLRNNNSYNICSVDQHGRNSDEELNDKYGERSGIAPRDNHNTVIDKHKRVARHTNWLEKHIGDTHRKIQHNTRANLSKVRSSTRLPPCPGPVDVYKVSAVH